METKEKKGLEIHIVLTKFPDSIIRFINGNGKFVRIYDRAEAYNEINKFVNSDDFSLEPSNKNRPRPVKKFYINFYPNPGCISNGDWYYDNRNVWFYKFNGEEVRLNSKEEFEFEEQQWYDDIYKNKKELTYKDIEKIVDPIGKEIAITNMNLSITNKIDKDGLLEFVDLNDRTECNLYEFLNALIKNTLGTKIIKIKYNFGILSSPIENIGTLYVSRVYEESDNSLQVLQDKLLMKQKMYKDHGKWFIGDKDIDDMDRSVIDERVTGLIFTTDCGNTFILDTQRTHKSYEVLGITLDKYNLYGDK